MAAVPIRDLLAPDHADGRRELRGSLGFLELLDDIEVVGEAVNGRIAVAEGEASNRTTRSWIW